LVVGEAKIASSEAGSPAGTAKALPWYFSQISMMAKGAG